MSHGHVGRGEVPEESSDKEDSKMRHTPLGLLMISLSMGTVPLAAGCATTPIRTEASTSGIRAAEEVGAVQVPQASLHLQLAKEELAKAKQLASKGDKDQARSMLMRAEVDAEMAVALSRENAEMVDARAAMDRVIELRRQNQ
jgi:uncharacterized protein YpuA (DUF1002 family)